MSAVAESHERSEVPPLGAGGRLRVLQMVDSLGVGGAERVVAQLAQAAPHQPIDLTIATLRPRPGSVLVAEVEAAGGRVVDFEVKSPTAGIRLAPLELIRLLRFVRRGRFDVVHTHLNSADVLGALAGVLAGVPVVSTQHSVRRTAPNPIREHIRRFALRHVAREIIAVGESVAAVQRSELGAHASITVIPNPASPPHASGPGSRARIRAELGIRAEQPVLLAVGRLEAPKDHARLLDALPLVRRAHPDVVLLIAGEGSLRPVLEQRIEEIGATDTVHLLGLRDDLGDLLTAADLLVSSSAWEGMPMAILEAMAAGLPVVATDVGDCRQVIGPGGLVVEPADAAVLATGVIAALDPLARTAMGAVARERAQQHYGSDAWVRRVLAVYERAIVGPAP